MLFGAKKNEEMNVSVKIFLSTAVICISAIVASGGVQDTKDVNLQSGVAFDVDIVSNILELNVEAPSLYVKPSETVVVDMDVRHLLQRVNACQAMLGYNSAYLSAGSVLPGNGGPIPVPRSEGPPDPGRYRTTVGNGYLRRSTRI